MSRPQRSKSITAYHENDGARRRQIMLEDRINIQILQVLQILSELIKLTEDLLAAQNDYHTINTSPRSSFVRRTMTMSLDLYSENIIYQTTER